MNEVYIYAKDGKIKVLNTEDVEIYQDTLIRDGWIHTQILDVCVYIQYLHNICEDVDLFNEVKSLSKRLL